MTDDTQKPCTLKDTEFHCAWYRHACRVVNCPMAPQLADTAAEREDLLALILRTVPDIPSKWAVKITQAILLERIGK